MRKIDLWSFFMSEKISPSTVQVTISAYTDVRENKRFSLHFSISCKLKQIFVHKINCSYRSANFSSCIVQFWNNLLSLNQPPGAWENRLPNARPNCMPTYSNLTMFRDFSYSASFLYYVPFPFYSDE